MIRYHSAMKRYGGIAKTNSEINHSIFEKDGNYVLQHDISAKNIPDVFCKANAVFSVMSWRMGYKHFTQNTIAEKSTFDEYCAGISRTITRLKIPSFIITNRTFANKLGADRLVPIKFDRFGSNDLCAVWNYDGKIPETTTELMQWIGQKWDTVLDFCCGYGEITYYVNHAVLSDINTGCLDYVKEILLNGKTKN